MPFRERLSHWAGKDRKSKDPGKVDNIDSTSGSSSSLRPVTATKNSSTDTSNIPTSATGSSIDSSELATRLASSIHRTTGPQSDSYQPTSSQAPTSTQHAVPTKPSPQDIAKRIWDEAYNRLKQSEPKLVNAYEVVLSHEPQEDGSRLDGPLLGENLIERADSDNRWLRMEQIVQDGLKNSQKDSKMRQIVGTASGGVLSLNPLISSAL